MDCEHYISSYQFASYFCEPCICCMRLTLGESTIVMSRIIIVTDTVIERLQIHLCTFNAYNVYSCQMPAHPHYDHDFSITVLALYECRHMIVLY